MAGKHGNFRIQREAAIFYFFERAEHDGGFDQAGAFEDQILAIARKRFVALRIPYHTADRAAVDFFQLADDVMEKHSHPSFVFS